MIPLGWNSTHVVDNADILYLGDQDWQQTVLLFLDTYFFVFISFSVCQSACVSGLWQCAPPLYAEGIETPTKYLKRGDLTRP